MSADDYGKIDALNYHSLADFIACPELYRRKKLGMIEDVDTPAYQVGRALHMAVLEPDKFAATYAENGPINPKTGQPFGPETKAAQEWCKETGKEVLGSTVWARVAGMAANVRAHKDAARLLSAGAAEVTLLDDMLGRPCKGRLDWVCARDFAVVDVKSCENLNWFSHDARDKYNYHRQLAFYCRLYAAARDGILPNAYLIAVEKQHPYRCGVWEVEQALMEPADREIDAAMALLREYEKAPGMDKPWPTGFEGIRTLGLKGGVA